MTRGRTARIAVWLAGLALCIWQVANTRFVADLSSFLPDAPTPEQRLLVDQLRDGALSRVMLLGIEGADAASRSDLSRSLAAALRAHPDFAAVTNGGTSGLDRDRELLFSYRYALGPAVSEAPFHRGGPARGDLRDGGASRLFGGPAGEAGRHPRSDGRDRDPHRAVSRRGRPARPGRRLGIAGRGARAPHRAHARQRLGHRRPGSRHRRRPARVRRRAGRRRPCRGLGAARDDRARASSRPRRAR